MTIDPNNLSATAKLSFSDEFNDLSIWNGSNGTWSTNWWYKDEWGLFNKSNGSTLTGNNEQQWYINDNYAATSHVNPWNAEGGYLNITAQNADPAVSSLINDYKYTSGMLNSWHSFSQQYGYFEISAKMPAGQGLWPAFWLLPQDGSWPPEIDVFEVLGHDTDTLHVSVHSNASGSHELDHAAVATPDLSAAFHRYGVNWQADTITFYFDGRQVAQVATPADLHKPMYMIVNLAVGGHWPGAPDASTIFPATLQVDYIRAYQGLTSDGAQGGDLAPVVGLNLVAKAPGQLLAGNEGHDSLQGTAGVDTIYGNAGEDLIVGGDGVDQLNGNTGDDDVRGGAGDDWAYGGKDNDLVAGDDGADFVHGNLGDDTVLGGAGADTLRGGQGDDVIQGGAGDDWIFGDRGDDVLSGGDGADLFVVFDGAGSDRVLDFSRAQGDRIWVESGTYSVSQSGSDTVITLGADSQITLVGVQASSLTGDWIMAA